MKTHRTALVLILILASSVSWGKSFRVGDYEYETEKKGLYSNEVKLKKDRSNKISPTIPETITYEGIEYTVGIIDNDAFKDNKNIVSIQIPGSVHALGMNAFKNLKTLRKVVALPPTDELKTIVEKPLEQKPDLFPADLAIGFCSFAKCENLDSIDLSARKTIVLVPKNLYGTKAWGFSYPFEDCKSLKSVVFGDVVFTDDGMKIFKGCHALDNFVTSTVNPSKFKKFFESDCPFMTRVYPKIYSMTESEYTAYLNNNLRLAEKNSKMLSSETDVIINNLGSRTTESSNFLETSDIMSIPIQRKDNNGNICPLLKVISTQNNLIFEGNIVGNIDYKNGNQYWVYLSPGSQKIRINAPGNNPKIIIFNDYGIHHLESRRIYEYSYEGIPTQKLKIIYIPTNATVLIDGNIYEGENGIVETDLTLGEHSYIVAAKGFVSSEGVVILKSDGQTNINISLTEARK